MYSQIRLAAIIFSAFLFQACVASAQAGKVSINPKFVRKYKPGETYLYKLTTVVFHNDKPQSTIVATCSLTVVKDSAGIPYDEIHWLSSKTIKGKDTIDESADARNVKPYRISLHPSGRLDIPPIEVASMTGAITDLNTFFVAISPQLGVSFPTRKGDSAIKNDPVKGDFGNRKTILKGEDCLAVTLYFTDENRKSGIYETTFLPPARSCLNYLLSDMQTPVAAGVINNFQMVQPGGRDKYNVLYGNEQFTIKSTVNKSDGKLVLAEMNNLLNLQMKIQCDGAYANCQGPFPFRIKRLLKLELLK